MSYHSFSFAIKKKKKKKIHTVSWSKKPHVPRQLVEAIIPTADR